MVRAGTCAAAFALALSIARAGVAAPNDAQRCAAGKVKAIGKVSHCLMNARFNKQLLRECAVLLCRCNLRHAGVRLGHSGAGQAQLAAVGC